MNFFKPLSRALFFLMLMLFTSGHFALAMGPTIAQTGFFDSISSHQVIQAKIDGKIEQICLPKFEFETEIDDRELKKQIKNGLNSQEAIFHLYHDGLARPKKQGGMLFASDVYLKDIKMTYTGFLRKLGLKFKISKIPPFEDKAHLRGVSYHRHIVAEQMAADKAAKEKPEPAGSDKQKNISTMRIQTIWDVLPRGVIPPAIRRQQKEIETRIKAMKSRPYRAEIVKVDPVRWASGKMGTLAADGSITGSYLEGQNPDLQITTPSESNWLSAAMISELKDQPCEFIFQLDLNGHEIVTDNRYFLRDIYFTNLKISWDEWLKKHGKNFVDPGNRKDFADKTIDLQVKLVSGTFAGMRAAVVIGADFPAEDKLVKKSELIRVFAPKPFPKKFVAFAKRFNQLFKGKPAEFSILLCPDGKPYTELGQKRARRVFFPESQNTMQMLQQQLLNGQIK